MRFYVSWYYGDPLYQCYDPDCHMLISPTSVSREWTLRDLPVLPRHVMIDSGGFRYMTEQHKMPTARETFERQLQMLGDVDLPATLCALDFPMAERGLSSNEWDRRLTQTLAFAEELKRLIARHDLGKNVEWMVIVQGKDVPSLIFCAHELKAMGFTTFGVGSLVGLFDLHETVQRVQAVVSVVGAGVHVFGLSSAVVIRALSRVGVTSFDSSRPVKSSAYNEILYSYPSQAHPLCRYGILDKGRATGIIPQARCLAHPLPCSCPICQQDPLEILRVGDRRAIDRRAIHNYFHFKASIGDTPLSSQTGFPLKH